MSTPPMPFDAVVVSDGPNVRSLTAEEFFGLPLAERIQHVVQRRAVFYTEGKPVDAKAAFAQLRKFRAPPPSGPAVDRFGPTRH